jgi:hypothetical protein
LNIPLIRHGLHQKRTFFEKRFYLDRKGKRFGILAFDAMNKISKYTSRRLDGRILKYVLESGQIRGEKDNERKLREYSLDQLDISYRTNSHLVIPHNQVGDQDS